MNLRHARPQAVRDQETACLEGRDLNNSTARTLREKISDNELLQVVTQDVAKPISVLIEIDLPKRRVKLAPSRTQNSSQRTLVRIIPLTPAEESEANARVSQMKESLERTLGVSPRWLSSSRSFVAKATPQQLQEIAMFEHVKAIWPNTQRTFSHTTMRDEQ